MAYPAAVAVLFFEEDFFDEEFEELHAYLSDFTGEYYYDEFNSDCYNYETSEFEEECLEKYRENFLFIWDRSWFNDLGNKHLIKRDGDYDIVVHDFKSEKTGVNYRIGKFKYEEIEDESVAAKVKDIDQNAIDSIDWSSVYYFDHSENIKKEDFHNLMKDNPEGWIMLLYFTT